MESSLVSCLIVISLLHNPHKTIRWQTAVLTWQRSGEVPQIASLPTSIPRCLAGALLTHSPRSTRSTGSQAAVRVVNSISQGVEGGLTSGEEAVHPLPTLHTIYRYMAPLFHRTPLIAPCPPLDPYDH